MNKVEGSIISNKRRIAGQIDNQKDMGFNTCGLVPKIKWLEIPVLNLSNTKALSKRNPNSSVSFAVLKEKLRSDVWKSISTVLNTLTKSSVNVFSYESILNKSKSDFSFNNVRTNQLRNRRHSVCSLFFIGNIKLLFNILVVNRQNIPLNNPE